MALSSLTPGQLEWARRTGDAVADDLAVWDAWKASGGDLRNRPPFIDIPAATGITREAYASYLAGGPVPEVSL